MEAAQLWPSRLPRILIACRGWRDCENGGGLGAASAMGKARQLEAEARGEAAALHSRKDLVRDQRYSEDYPSRGGGVVGH